MDKFTIRRVLCDYDPDANTYCWIIYGGPKRIPRYGALHCVSWENAMLNAEMYCS